MTDFSIYLVEEVIKWQKLRKLFLSEQILADTKTQLSVEFATEMYVSKITLISLVSAGSKIIYVKWFDLDGLK